MLSFRKLRHWLMGTLGVAVLCCTLAGAAQAQKSNEDLSPLYRINAAQARFQPRAMLKLTVEAVRLKSDLHPEVGIVLGSGLGDLADLLQDKVEIPYASIPGFVVSTVEGHAGSLVLGKLEGRPVVVMRGRVHCYEGYHIRNVAFPILLMKELGAKTLVVTNSSGAISPGRYLGEIVLLKDHLNFLGANPLVGNNDPKLGPRFVDMNKAYTPSLRQKALAQAQKLEIPLKEGVYAAMLGPSYETPAERRMLRLVGADVVGMSTVPEVIAAVYSGMQVIGFSCVTDVPADIPSAKGEKAQAAPATTNHQQVLEAAQKAQRQLGQLIRALIPQL